ncbi:unnamed protein product [Absidia cylindrospora]
MMMFGMGWRYDCNCAILNKLYLASGTKINKTLAMDFIGNNGYIYMLVPMDNLYVPKDLSPVFLPTDISHFRLFKKTVRALFMWKEFLCDMIKTLKRALVVKQLENDVYDMVRWPDTYDDQTESDLPSPPMFFSTSKQIVYYSLPHATSIRSLVAMKPCPYI